MKEENEEMALIQYAEMNSVVNGIVKAVRAKAAEFGCTYGAIAICYNNTAAYSKGNDIVAYEDLERGEDRLRVFQLVEGGSHIARDEKGKELFQCFGVAAMKITGAAKAYRKDADRHLLSSEGEDEDNIDGRVNWGGCILFPIYINHHHCANIYVSVSGCSTDEQCEECAWAALEPIRKNLLGCYPSVPSRYGKNG